MGKTSLRRLFFRYLVYIMCWLVFSLILILKVPYVASGILYPANTGEKELSKTVKDIQKTDSLEEVEIPYFYQYGIFDDQSKCIKSNLEDTKVEKYSEMKENAIRRTSWNTIVNAKSTKYGKLVISYQLVADFTNPTLYKYLPPGEYLFLGMSILIIILGVLILSGLFGKRITKELRVLIDVTDKVSKLDLDFETEQSKIKEIDAVLGAVERMRNGLKTALHSQWQTERVLKESTQAITHDIKTPLTIIKGNCELLAETTLDEEQEVYVSYIENHLNRMNYYVEELTTISGLSEEVKQTKKEYSISYVNQQIKSLTEELIEKKELNLLMEEENSEEKIIVNLDEIMRAIQNIVTNGVDYTPEKSDFSIETHCTADDFVIEIVDNGSGFSQEALEKGFSDFYTEDKSRSQGQHYGLGLTIAKKMVTKNKGTITLENKLKNNQVHGGKVRIKLPLANFNKNKNQP